MSVGDEYLNGWLDAFGDFHPCEFGEHIFKSQEMGYTNEYDCECDGNIKLQTTLNGLNQIHLPFFEDNGMTQAQADFLLDHPIWRDRTLHLYNMFVESDLIFEDECDYFNHLRRICYKQLKR